MSHDINTLEQELEVATLAARAAGDVLLRFFRGDFDVERKAGDEPVTEADRAADRLIGERLRGAFPDDGLLSEEQADHESWIARRRAWVVDPMDGTKDFVHGREGFSVMIGLLEATRPVLGVVHQPTTGLTYRGCRGGGAELLASGGERTVLRTTDERDPGRARLVASYSSRSAQIDRMKQQLGIDDEQNIGSVGLKVGLIARGMRDLYLNPDGHCKLWDVCAPEAILSEAGGRFSDIHGEPLRYDDPQQIRFTRGLIASNGACHAAVVERLAPLFRGR